MNRFRIIGAAILVWNLFGVLAYLRQATMDYNDLALTDPVSAEAFIRMPAWVWAAYAIAVLGGTLGAILLLARRSSAWACFALSIAGICVQFGWTFLGFNLVAQKGPSTLVFPLVILAIAVASLAYARAKRADGTLR